jgi:hypothetical protein
VLTPIIILVSANFAFRGKKVGLSLAVHLSTCILVLIGFSNIDNFLKHALPRIEEKDPNDPFAGLDLPSLPPPHVPLGPPPFSSDHPHFPPPPPPHGARGPRGHHGKVPPWRTRISRAVVSDVSHAAPLGLPIYLAVVFLVNFLQYRRELAEREQAALRLENELTQAQHDLLRAQLQPHFLFNTLNAISSLVHSNPDKADRMVIELSDLLRSTLDLRNERFVSLEKELQTVERYIRIQQTRFEDRLVYKVEVPVSLLDAKIPTMILMPMVENAIRYAVERQQRKTTVRIEAEKVGEQLWVLVVDDGQGLNSAYTGGTGVGMGNVEGRLKTLYPQENASVELESAATGGAQAILKIPYLE